jgi:hypothetical protein
MAITGLEKGASDIQQVQAHRMRGHRRDVDVARASRTADPLAREELHTERIGAALGELHTHA